MIIVIKTRYANGSGCTIVMNIICAFRVRLLPDMNFQLLYCSCKEIASCLLQQSKRSSSEFTFPRVFVKAESIGVLLSADPVRNKSGFGEIF